MEGAPQSDLITDVHRNYEPLPEEIFLTIPGGEYQRMIWAEPMELREKEEDHWDNFEDYIKQNKLEALPEFFTSETRMGFRLLQGAHWDYKKAYDDIQLHQKWRNETLPLSAQPFKDFFDSGCLYCFARAKQGHHPVIVMNVKRLVSVKGSTLDDQAKFANFYFQNIVETMLVPGHVENWIVIIDFKGIGVTDMPVKQLQGMITALNRNFRGRMYRNVVVNTPTVLKGIWAMIYSWLDKFMQQKIAVTGDPKSELLKYINEDDLEVQYGGTKETLTTFWPIKI